jgi:hypothetical protein
VFKIVTVSAMMLMSLVLASCSTNSTSDSQSAAPTTQPVKTQYVTMPTGTSITVTLVDSIDTDVQTSGTEFRATMTGPIVVDGHTLFATGAGARGMLTHVVESGHLKTPAELNYRLTSIQDGSGDWIAVSTAIISEKMDSHTKREVGMIGGGAIVGGIVGKLVDKKGSTEVGALAGAAAGTGLAVATGKRDIIHKAGSAVTFVSNQSVQISLR